MERRGLAVVLLAAFVVCVAVGAGACGSGGKTRDAGRKQFLLAVHNPLSGSLSTRSDAELVRIGRDACAGLDRKESPDVIVAHLGGDPEPGSADFNAYSFAVAAAALHLCPEHKGVFGQVKF